MISLFYSLKRRTESENYGRHIIIDVVRKYAKGHDNLKILDLGAGKGNDLVNSRKAAIASGCNTVELYGLESYPPNVDQLKKIGVEVRQVDVEKEEFPYLSNTIDIVIMNQCLEHTKEIFHIMSEIGRILKKEGIMIIGVPNLASLHNRILLLFGQQPTAIHVFGPHVRGFTKNDFIKFAEVGGYFECVGFSGSNFYPFPKQIARVLSKIFPKLSVSIFFTLKSTGKNGVFSEILDKEFFETPFLR